MFDIEAESRLFFGLPLFSGGLKSIRSGLKVKEEGEKQSYEEKKFIVYFLCFGFNPYFLRQCPGKR